MVRSCKSLEPLGYHPPPQPSAQTDPHPGAPPQISFTSPSADLALCFARTTGDFSKSRPLTAVEATSQRGVRAACVKVTSHRHNAHQAKAGRICPRSSFRPGTESLILCSGCTCRLLQGEYLRRSRGRNFRLVPTRSAEPLSKNRQDTTCMGRRHKIARLDTWLRRPHPTKAPLQHSRR
jgi:hypothetical protein